MAEQKFRILALDGGGIRGAISAQILKKVQEKIHQKVGKDVSLNEYFDLIAGTSTGSILAAGLVLGMKLDEIVDIYLNRGQEIFSSSFFRQKISYWLNQPKYSNEKLKEILRSEKCFGEIPLANLREESKKRNPNSNPKARLLVLAYSTSQRYTNFFLSPLVDENPWYKNAKLWEVCLSSASAPTFFPPYQFNLSQDSSGNTGIEGPAEYSFVDGGVAANNPSLGALVHTLDIERIDDRKIKLEEISLLSIGTGRTTEPLEFKEVNSWGALGWASHIPDVFMGGQFQITADVCAQLIRSVNPNGYLRVQFPMNKRYTQENGKTVRLPKKDQVNIYTKKPLDEAMDRGDKPHVQNLIDTTDKFLGSKDDYCKFDGVKCSIEQAIEKFIEVNQ